MTQRLKALKPADVADRLQRSAAVLIDIREPDEFAARHIAGALSRPLSQFDPERLAHVAGREVVFTCKTGMRTGANCDRLADAIPGEAFVLEGGVDAWAAAGLPVRSGAA